MKIKFLGIKGESKSKGCSSCGGLKRTYDRFEYTKRIIFPSGKTETFTVGREYELNEREAEFLTTFSYMNGTEKIFPFIQIGS